MDISLYTTRVLNFVRLRATTYFYNTNNILLQTALKLRFELAAALQLYTVQSKGVNTMCSGYLQEENQSRTVQNKKPASQPRPTR